jgi:hypothetical protein
MLKSPAHIHIRAVYVEENMKIKNTMFDGYRLVRLFPRTCKHQLHSEKTGSYSENICNKFGQRPAIPSSMLEHCNKVTH